MHDDIKEILYSEEQIKARVKELGAQISKDFEGSMPIVIGILKGAIIFYADLMRELDLAAQLEFMIVSSYGAGTTPGQLVFKKDTDANLEGRNVLIVEDIIDSGNTLYLLKNELEKRKPAMVKICAFLDKPARRTAQIKADYVGFVCADEFVVGYGLDFAEKYRNLPYIGVLKPHVYEK
ncbi:MAG: hypoxanthine phosphoribosyltransferase [Clostridia bacterium]|jgi:hypoxanthine phosphoribosyltransferase|nr:hypoxanthine phosphoribosyltransferase [Clostridia bacterium]MBO7158625.1 hypoxanthine phosphoribosyltransferase [Clostridia bacterium]MBQ2254406.1 hypoxanthine phosphoribosyltransferase [Clostridia bacterium]MBQ5791360.1 hypoxanthine phosphoribosyltransferase [Clostridia bacterium]